MAELRIEQMRFEHPGGFTMGPFTLRMGPGIWRVTGANGAGKTTMLRLLGGDLAPGAGKVLWNGLNLYRKEAARRDVSLLLTSPEQPDFFTVEEAWKLMATLRGKPEWDGSSLQEKLNLEGNARLGSLSTGMRRRAELLSALAADPGLLLLDEVFAPLDPQGLEAVVAFLEAGRSRRVVLFTHHGDSPLLPDGDLQVPSWRR